MRPFEIALVCLLVLSAAFQVQSKRGRALVQAGCLLALALHLTFEGAHWQMIPAYLAIALLFPWREPTHRRAIAIGIAVILLTGFSCVAAAILPIFALPAPTGPYPVGTRMLYLKDPTRSNTIDGLTPGDAGSGRDIAVQLWYPATPSRNRFAAYRMLAEATLQSTYMSVVPTHSRLDAPLEEGATPWHVLLFNPAWNSRRGQSTALMEDLASHGYAVAAIDHSGRTGPISLPDGRVIRVAPDPDVDDLAHSTVDRVEAALNREVDEEAADNIFVLDQLELQNRSNSSPFFDRLDTGHAGAFGHSLGGAVAADACALDPRILSALSMSAPFFGKVRTMGLAKPYLFISEVVVLATPEQLARMSYGDRVDAETDLLDAANRELLLRQYGGYEVILKGANHSSFTDRAFYSPIRSLSGADMTPRDRVQFILRAYTNQFFDKTLRGQASPLLDRPGTGVTSPFPEVTQKYFPGAVQSAKSQ
jgi:dienelactone hydrolase